MIFTDGRCFHGLRLLRALAGMAPVLCLSLSPSVARAAAAVAANEICLPAGTYPMIGGGKIEFSHDKTCFTRPTTRAYPWEKKIARAQRSAPDPFTGDRLVRYDYHDGLYHCSKRNMRLPSVEEMKALYAYAIAGESAATGNRDATVPPKRDAQYAERLHGWGRGSSYWTHTFAGRGKRKMINLANGQVTIGHGHQLGYVSCLH